MSTLLNATMGVPGDTTGTVTTGDAPLLDSELPGAAATEVVEDTTVELDPSTSTVLVELDEVVDVVVGASTFRVFDIAELPVPAMFAATTAHEYSPSSATTNVSEASSDSSAPLRNQL
jgi:hypothetical protein